MALHATGVKMVNMRIVRLTYRVTLSLIISGAQARKSESTPKLNVEICCNKDQKITNTVINKQFRLDFFKI